MSQPIYTELLPENRPPATGRKPSSFRWLLFVLLAAAAVVLLRFTVFEPTPLTVDVARVAPGTVDQTVSNTRAGTVKARRRARLTPETAGRVAELPHREGRRVKKGELLLRLDDALQKAQLELAVEDVRAAAARADEACLVSELAASELTRHQELKTNGIASEQLMDKLQSEQERARAACRAGRAGVEQARARQRYVGAQLRLTELRAPFDGVVAEVGTELGEWIGPALGGAMPVIDLLDPGSLYVTAPIDEMDAGRVRVGQAVRLSVDSHQGQSFPGRLVRVAPYVLDVVEQNRTLEVEAEFDSVAQVEGLLPGTSADVEVILERREGVLQIPTGAIAQGKKVLVVLDGRLEERVIRTGLSNWRATEVLDGLSAGERVVVARNKPAIKAGALVEIRERP